MFKNYFTLADIMNYLYCPRIIYFVYVLKIPQFTTHKEIIGREKDAEWRLKLKRRQLIEKQSFVKYLYGIVLQSDALALVSKIDCVLVNSFQKIAYPIQIKNSYKPRCVFQTQRYQLIGEALLIEDNWPYTVPYGYIYFILSNEFVKIIINKENKTKFLRILNNIKDIINQEKIPHSTPYKKRCQDCCYKNLC